jgi:plastocyanin
MSKPNSPGVFCLTAACFFAGAAPIHATDFVVLVDASGFSPSALSISTGDTVIWVSDDDTDVHTTTSNLSIFNANYWTAYLFDIGDFYAKTFNTAGTFTYYDQFTFSTGSITVSPPAALLTLESPRIASGKFLFEATGLTVGKTNVLYSSANLTSWNPAVTNVTSSSSMTFTNPITAGPKFFELRELP